MGRRAKAKGWRAGPEIKKSDLFRIFAANVRDGEKINLHTRAFSQQITKLVRDRAAAKVDLGVAGAMTNIHDYFACLEDACFGDPVSPPGEYPVRTGTPLLLQSAAGPCPDEDEWYSSVVTLDHWMMMLRDKKYYELFALAHRSKSGSRDSLIQAKLSTLTSGFFQIREDFRFGNPMVWFTPRRRLEARLRAYTKARKGDAARDFLGLVHRCENEYLVAVHVPAELLVKIKSARPTIADAGRHRRFMAASASSPASFGPAWGQTLDLEAFETGRAPKDGGAERVSECLTHAAAADTELGFTYLGKLTSSRGLALDTAGRACSDSDAEFAKSLIARDKAAFDKVMRRL